jgi:6-phosphogluconate dehydrogenase
MPGGNPAAWPHVKEIFQAISAKADNGEPCCDWVGKDGAGHYVKMVHNGIEYGDIQIICEAYQLLSQGLGFTAEELSAIFAKWNTEELDSYLIEIAGHVLSHVDADGKPLVEKILDVAGQKGTGKWACESSLEFGVPLTLISEAVYARCLSAIKEQRVVASKLLKGPQSAFKGDRNTFVQSLKNALYASKITSYAQGFMLMKEASKQFNWEINFGNVALMWRNGCIIRSKFLGNIKEAFDRQPNLDSLLLDPFFKTAVEKGQAGWREAVVQGVQLGIPMPCLSTALAFFDGYRTARLPANLLQALRDYFGAHTYERVDQPRGKFFHTNWTGTGGKVSASSYTV